MTVRCTLPACLLAFSLSAATCLHAEPIRVQQTQGATRGFLFIRSESGQMIGHGDLIQTAHGSRITSRLILTFKDGSIDDDTTVFTQARIFQMVTDHHIQKGPFFSKPSDIFVDAHGNVTSRTFDKDGKVKVETEHVDPKPDVSNGMLGTLLLNVPPNTPEFQLSLVAATGKGRLVTLKIAPDGEAKFDDVGLAHTATIFRVKIDLGGVAAVVAPVIGKQPGDIFVWVMGGPAPALIRLVGALSEGGPVVSIELSGATFPHPAPEGH